MEFSFKTYIKTVFPFSSKKEIGYDILGLVAKRKGLVENQIVNRLSKGTRRKVNWSIQNFLIPNGFLFSKAPKKSRRNIKIYDKTLSKIKFRS